MLNQERIFRVVRFCMVGGTVAVVDFSTVWLLSHFLLPLIAVSVGYFIGVTCHFLLNKFWVFRCRRKDYFRQLMQYLTVVFASWLATVSTVQICLSSITDNVLIAKLFAIPPATFVGFVLMQFFVFRRPPKPRLHRSQIEEERIHSVLPGFESHFPPSRFLSGSIARKSDERFGS